MRMKDNIKKPVYLSSVRWEIMEKIAALSFRNVGDQITMVLSEWIDQYLEENPEVAEKIRSTPLDFITFSDLTKSLTKQANPKKVLCVYDDPNFQNTLGFMVEAAGHKPIYASSVKEALSESGYDAAIIDYGLKETTALELFPEMPKNVKALRYIIISAGKIGPIKKEFSKITPQPDLFADHTLEIKKIREWLTKL